MTETDTWVSRDGSTVNYGAIDPEKDFFDPERQKLFDSEVDEPDEENYEGYTGNAGWLCNRLQQVAPSPLCNMHSLQCCWHSWVLNAAKTPMLQSFAFRALSTIWSLAKVTSL